MVTRRNLGKIVVAVTGAVLLPPLLSTSQNKLFAAERIAPFSRPTGIRATSIARNYDSRALGRIARARYVVTITDSAPLLKTQLNSNIVPPEWFQEGSSPLITSFAVLPWVAGAVAGAVVGHYVEKMFTKHEQTYEDKMRHSRELEDEYNKQLEEESDEFAKAALERMKKDEIERRKQLQAERQKKLAEDERRRIELENARNKYILDRHLERMERDREYRMRSWNEGERMFREEMREKTFGKQMFA